MKNRKILYVIIVILTLGLFVTFYLFLKEKRRNNILPEVTQLLSILTKDVYTNIDERFADYDQLSQWIKEDVDSFYIYSEYKPIYRSKQFKDFYRRYTEYSLDADEQLFKLIELSQTSSSKDFTFLKKLVDFVFITRMERLKLENFCLFDGVGVNVFPQKDTILKGEEYIASIDYAAVFFQTIPTMTIDGDTVPTNRNSQVFKEIPQKSGKVRHECTITFNQQGHFLELPFTIEYYVN